MKRRRVLEWSSLGLAALAGCLTDSGMRAGTAPSETDSTLTTEDLQECTYGFSVHVEPFEPIKQLPMGYCEPDSPCPIIDEAIKKGSATIEQFGGPPRRANVIVELEGEFYRVYHKTVGTESVPAQRVTLYWERGQTAPDEARTLHYNNLPESDQVALRYLIDGPKYNNRGHPQEKIKSTEVHAPFPSGTEDSRLNGKKTVWVEWRDRTYKVQLVGPAPNMERATYRYEVSKIACSPEAFREFVIAQYVASLNNPSPALRGLLEKAIKDGYEECEPASSPLEELQSKLEDFPALPHPQDEESYVNFEDRRYLIRVNSWIKD